MKLNKVSRRILKVLCILAVVAGVIVAAGLVLRNIGRKTIQNRIAEVGGSENVQTLNRLNSAWVLPEDYTLEIVESDGLTMEYMRSGESTRAILQLHGGAYTRSLKDNGATYRRSAAQYLKISGAAVLTPDYRVAPADPYPAALEDAISAYEWLLSEGYDSESIIIAGDSAGGGLTLALTLYLRDNGLPMPCAVITMSPWTNLNYRRYTPAYVGKGDAKTPYISPYYGEYSGFPPMLMQVGGDEALLNDTLSVAQKAAAAGADVRQTTYPGMFHVFQMLFPELESANSAWDEAGKFIDEMFGN